MNKTPDFKKLLIATEPYYHQISDEVAIFEAASENMLPVIIKGPTGCGKSRFVEYMAWKLKRPLIIVACHDDLTASDLTGRYLIKSGETLWVDGPLSSAVRAGAICYLDEIVEARKDATVIIHPLADDRRELPIDKLNTVLKAGPEFCLTMSYNPGYQSVLKELKQSTKQRFITLDFDYPDADIEAKIIQKESKIDDKTANNLVKFAIMTRNLKGQGLIEGASTRLLVHAAKLIKSNIPPATACQVAIIKTLTDDTEMTAAITELSTSLF